ncbi:MAG: ROK family protein [Verrucomicrobiota bacterium JB025]|nr:ROK family protein [Verrucomicrobiota bacterium JB025]
MKLFDDKRVVMTLDAGGTSFRFHAMQGGKPVTETIKTLIDSGDLQSCLDAIFEGFEKTRAACPEAPVAISFAFPGPADYPAGIIGDLGNLPGFRGGVPLGPMLEEKFGIPVFINNDGDLFAYGEALAGFLPVINQALEDAGNPKRFHNLLGVTFGTGFGGGIVRNGELHVGDNSIAGEIWCSSNIVETGKNAEEGVAIRAVKREYAKRAGISPEDAPDPFEIEQIAFGKAEGDADAAKTSYQLLGKVAGGAMANALTMVDGLAVIGGGLSAAAPLYMPSLVETMRGKHEETGVPRIASKVFNLEDEAELAEFLMNHSKEITVPGTDRKVSYDPVQRIGVGVSKMGTSEAITTGAYAFALKHI